MTRLATGILAHVAPGKTTLSEALLYESGAIRKLGRVDSKDAFLDNNSICN
ncbi:MAG: GTP-binding protein [Treponema sp.]|nr:GTP-binding protein [Treponema sp.]